MADISSDQLQSLVDTLNAKAKKFSDASKSILDQARQLDWSAEYLADNPSSWAGKGSQAFQKSWMGFHGNALNAALTLSSTAQALKKFAGQLETHVQNLRNLEAQQVAAAGLTIGMTILSIAQLGLDPLTDTAAVGSGAGEAAVLEEISAEEDAIATLDTQISAEIEGITGEITDVTQLDDLQLPADQAGEVTQLENELLDEEIQNSDPTKYYRFSSTGGGGTPPGYTGGMPPGLNNSVGQDLLQQAKDMGVEVRWDAQSQADLANYDSIGLTFMENGKPVISLAPDATNAVLYEEILHAQNAIDAGDMDPSDEAAWTEEIMVEHQVLQDAEHLGMDEAEFDDLSQVRQDYIDDLRDLYQQEGKPWPPDSLKPYLQDPPKPPGMH